MDVARWQSDYICVRGVEAIKHEVFALDEHYCGANDCDCSGLDQIDACNAQDIAEKNMHEMYLCFNFCEHDKAECEHTRKDDSHDGVFFDAAAVFNVAG